jgi:hypothetical protein
MLCNYGLDTAAAAHQAATIKQLLVTMHATAGNVAAAECVSSQDLSARAEYCQKAIVFLRSHRLIGKVNPALMTRLEECAAECTLHNVDAE